MINAGYLTQRESYRLSIQHAVLALAMAALDQPL